MIEPSEFFECLHTIWIFTQFAFIVICALGGATCVLVLLASYAYLCVGMCAYCMASREEIAMLTAEDERVWRAKRRRGGRGVLRVMGEELGLVRDEKETRGVVAEQVKPREAGVRYEPVESGRYGTLEGAGEARMWLFARCRATRVKW